MQIIKEHLYLGAKEKSQLTVGISLQLLIYEMYEGTI